nr:hypothetical protein [Tanacetum cinerariifolium]
RFLSVDLTVPNLTGRSHYVTSSSPLCRKRRRVSPYSSSSASHSSSPLDGPSRKIEVSIEVSIEDTTKVGYEASIEDGIKTCYKASINAKIKEMYDHILKMPLLKIEEIKEEQKALKDRAKTAKTERTKLHKRDSVRS